MDVLFVGLVNVVFHCLMILSHDYASTGAHESQAAEGGEADLEKFYTRCLKNPGHSGFIPLEKFTIDDLPESHRDEDLYEYIKVIANLTVRVDVNFISADRPQFWPKTKSLYPFQEMRGKTCLRCGSGRISEVMTSNVRFDGTCPCHKCKLSATPSLVWRKIYVETATHHVFDDTEASHTCLKLFYDRDNSPVVILDKVSIYYVNIKYDRCRLLCVTCDKGLGDKLFRMYERFDELWKKVFYKFKSIKDVHRLTFIVSHPHGCYKQVSLGQWTAMHQVGREHKFTYTTCTCRGSSGATVHCVGFTGGWWLYQHVHSGVLGTGLNYSGVGVAI